jgi:hypothetical protein
VRSGSTFSGSASHLRCRSGPGLVDRAPLNNCHIGFSSAVDVPRRQQFAENRRLLVTPEVASRASSTASPLVRLRYASAWRALCWLLNRSIRPGSPPCELV